MAFLEVKNIDKKVNEVNILFDINLTFDRTGLVFIAGKSGAGKSTLMNIIGQLDREYSGQVLLENVECRKDQSALCEIRREKIGFIFQDFNLLGDLNVDENIRLAIQLSGCSSVNVNEILNTFHISDCKKKKCSVLSGGERQRVAIARAICKDSKIILADEPTGNLDHANAMQVFEVLKQISAERLVIVISHDMEAATEYADRIISIADGRVISDEETVSEKDGNKVDCIVEYSKDKMSHNIFWIIIKQHLKQNKKRNRMIIGICAILLFFTSLITSMVNAMLNVNSSINAVTGNDMISVYNTEDFRLTPLSKDFIEEVSQTACKHVLAYHQLNMGVLKDADYIGVDCQVFENNDFFAERMRFYNMEMPQNKYEIIVNTCFAQNVFGTTDCIGKTFELIAFAEEGIECTVHAVTETLSEEREEIYITKEVMDELYSGIMDESFSLITYSESKMNTAHLYINEYTGEEKLCYGKCPTNENEILINAGGVNSILAVLELPYASVSMEDIVNGKLSDEIQNDILGACIDMSTMNDSSYFEDMKIVGITENEDSYVQVYMNDAGIKKIQEPSLDSVEIYLSDRGENLEEITTIVEKHGYALSDKGGAKADIIASRLSIPVSVIGVLSVVTFILAFLFMKLTTKINILNQKQEIGVIKALGASDRQIKRIYLLENIILLLYALIPVIVITILLQIASSKDLLMYQGIRMYELNVAYFIVVCIVGILTVWIASLMEVGKIAKLNLVDILRKSS